MFIQTYNKQTERFLLLIVNDNQKQDRRHSGSHISYVTNFTFSIPSVIIR